MAKLRTIIIDDEEPARERLAGLLTEYPEIEVIAEAEDGEEALEKIMELKPDLLFLDIQMPLCSGMEVAASLPDERPAIIFCTAYDQYAIDAFETNAVDYLLKPVTRQRLESAVARAVKADRDVRSRMGHASDNLTVPTRFLGRRANKYIVIPQQGVFYFSSEGGLTKVHTREGFFWMEPSLTELENRLDKAGFYRVSRQHLVNLDHVEEIIPVAGENGKTRMADGKFLKVSRRKMKDLLERLEFD